jgi:hypothetical protein
MRGLTVTFCSLHAVLLAARATAPQAVYLIRELAEPGRCLSECPRLTVSARRAP